MNLKLDLWYYRLVYVVEDIQMYLKGTLILTGFFIQMRVNPQVDLFFVVVLSLESNQSRQVKTIVSVYIYTLGGGGGVT